MALAPIATCFKFGNQLRITTGADIGVDSMILAFYAVGFLFFAISKIFTIRGGQLITFGSSGMSKRNKVPYRLGYVLMFVGVFLTPFLLIPGIPG